MRIFSFSLFNPLFTDAFVNRINQIAFKISFAQVLTSVK